eukprot:CAMPEP_0170751646 /NCGR_PEP_ID=MMETSP0437-20130122/11560_1 /TAXON_ID=0 /ORGANISM="Sexangularia sp." /LENGTH=455 /DNA_ID=CAMNT_0011090691 /DNA_START=73 /DNA_END=1440 /DNA_ORIENTATION=+
MYGGVAFGSTQNNSASRRGRGRGKRGGGGAGRGGAGRGAFAASPTQQHGKQICRNWQAKGECRFGGNCHHAWSHTPQYAPAGAAAAVAGTTLAGTATTLVPLLPDGTKYSAAGLFPYRLDPASGKLYVLLTVDHRKDKSASNAAKKFDYLSVAGGGSIAADTSAEMTAIRCFWEKSYQVLDGSVVQGMLGKVQAAAASPTPEFHVAFYGKGKYALLLYHLTHDLDIVQRAAATNKGSVPQANLSPAKSLHWVMVEQLYGALASAAGPSAPVSLDVDGIKVRMYSLLVSLLSEAPIRMLLEGLQGGPAAATAALAEAARASASAGAVGGAGGGGIPDAGDFATTGVQFVRVFFEQFNNPAQRGSLAALFAPNASLTTEGALTTGAPAVVQSLVNFGQVTLNPDASRIECQPSAQGGILVLVQGAIAPANRPFGATFFLQATPGAGFTVASMVLRAM